MKPGVDLESMIRNWSTAHGWLVGDSLPAQEDKT